MAKGLLMPRNPKYRKHQRRVGCMSGVATKCNTLSRGDCGIQSLGFARITGKQIEAARVVMTHTTNRRCKIYINIFPHKSYTKKPIGARLGKGKGVVDYWAAIVKPGTVMYEIVYATSISKEITIKALKLAMYKLAVKCKIIFKEN